MNVRHPVTFLFMALLAGCQSAEEEKFQGYVEGEPVLVAAQQSGQLTSLMVQRGDEVKSGTPLFSQDQATEAASATGRFRPGFDHPARQTPGSQAAVVLRE